MSRRLFENFYWPYNSLVVNIPGRFFNKRVNEEFVLTIRMQDPAFPNDPTRTFLNLAFTPGAAGSGQEYVLARVRIGEYKGSEDPYFFPNQSPLNVKAVDLNANWEGAPTKSLRYFNVSSRHFDEFNPCGLLCATKGQRGK